MECAFLDNKFQIFRLIEYLHCSKNGLQDKWNILAGLYYTFKLFYLEPS